MQLLIMERLLGLFEDSIRLVREGRTSDLNNNFYNNETLPPRIKTIIRSIEALSKRQQGDNGLLLVAVSKFKDALALGGEGVEEILSDEALPGPLCETLREIHLLSEDRLQQLNSMFEDVFFYKDIIQAILADKNISEDEIAMRENIAEDKRKAALRLLSKVEELRHAHPPPQQQQHQGDIERLEAQHVQDTELLLTAEKRVNNFREEVQNMREQLDSTRAELAKAKERASKVEKESSEEREGTHRLRDELAETLRESELLQSSLAAKQREADRMEAEREAADERLVMKEAAIAQLQRTLEKLTEEAATAKRELAAVREEKRIAESHLREAESRWQVAEKLRGQAESAVQVRSSRILELEEEGERSRLEQSKVEIDRELVRRASVFLESAEKFSQIYAGRSARSEVLEAEPFPGQSQDALSLSLSASRNRKQAEQRVSLASFLGEVGEEGVVGRLLQELPGLAVAEVVYRYPEDRSVAFVDRLRRRNNLLLVCVAESGALLGAFSSGGFTEGLRGRQQRIFLFCARGKAVRVLRGEEGCAGVAEDADFLSFGREQLNLEQGCDYATCCYEPGDTAGLQFVGSVEERLQFLSLTGSPSNQRIPLRRYHVLHLLPK